MNKKLRMPRTDLKKKPSYELLIKIGKNAIQEITPHPFTKVKPPKKETIEEIFIKQSEKKSNKKSENKKSIKRSNPKKKI